MQNLLLVALETASKHTLMSVINIEREHVNEKCNKRYI